MEYNQKGNQRNQHQISNNNSPNRECKGPQHQQSTIETIESTTITITIQQSVNINNHLQQNKSEIRSPQQQWTNRSQQQQQQITGNNNVRTTTIPSTTLHQQELQQQQWVTSQRHNGSPQWVLNGSMNHKLNNMNKNQRKQQSTINNNTSITTITTSREHTASQ